MRGVIPDHKHEDGLVTTEDWYAGVEWRDNSAMPHCRDYCGYEFPKVSSHREALEAAKIHASESGHRCTVESVAAWIVEVVPDLKADVNPDSCEVCGGI